MHPPSDTIFPPKPEAETATQPFLNNFLNIYFYLIFGCVRFSCSLWASL